jgi:hypothetical protein
MLDMGRWVYDPKRCLSIECRTPAQSDDKLKEYAISLEAALEAAKPFSLELECRRKRNRTTAKQDEGIYFNDYSLW